MHGETLKLETQVSYLPQIDGEKTLIIKAHAISICTF